MASVTLVYVGQLLYLKEKGGEEVCVNVIVHQLSYSGSKHIALTDTDCKFNIQSTVCVCVRACVRACVCACV